MKKYIIKKVVYGTLINYEIHKRIKFLWFSWYVPLKIYHRHCDVTWHYYCSTTLEGAKRALEQLEEGTFETDVTLTEEVTII